jgi:hypothetical protein
MVGGGGAARVVVCLDEICEENFRVAAFVDNPPSITQGSTGVVAPRLRQLPQEVDTQRYAD